MFILDLRRECDLWHALLWLLMNTKLGTYGKFWRQSFRRVRLGLLSSTWTESRRNCKAVIPLIVVDLLWILHERDEVLAFIRFDWVFERLKVCDFPSVVWFHALPKEMILDCAI